MKKICHLCLCGPYNEGWNYQENVLPKYHRKQGNDVYQIVTPYMWEGTHMVLSDEKEYVNENGISIYRCRAKKRMVGGIRLNRYPDVYRLLESISPEILFIHGLQNCEMKSVVNYLRKHIECVTYVDNHSDFTNSARNWFSKKILHGILWKYYAHKMLPYVRMFYGVLPARVDFLVDVYDLPQEKVQLLVMGADDELVFSAREHITDKRIREKYGIDKSDFLLMTGGKIDLFKSQILMLMEAVHKIGIPSVKLIVFGSVCPELEEKVKYLSDGIKVQFIGWIDAKESYDYFAVSDLVVFPGRHSVFWEQVAGQGIPLLVKDLEGTHHIDLGGNVLFLKENSVEEIVDYVKELTSDKDKYLVMKKNAQEKGMAYFSYDEIARKSIY